MKIQITPSARKAGSKSPTAASRKALAGAGQAMPGGRYPIPNVDFLQRAIKSIGRTPAAKRAAVVAWIKKRAAALGRSDLVKNLSNELKAIELAGAAVGSDDVQPQRGTKTEKLPSAKNNKQVQSQLKSGALKTRQGKLLYAKLRAQGYPHSISAKAAQKSEQGMLTGEMANSTPAVELAGEPAPPNPHGFKNAKAANAYKKAKKKGLPEKMAKLAGKFIDKKLGDPKPPKA